MRSLRTILLTAGVVILFTAIGVVIKQARTAKGDLTMNSAGDSTMQLTSPAFAAGSSIPVQYTCMGENTSPPLDISGAPNAAKSLALVLHDPDAVSSDWVHWLLWNIPPSTTIVAAHSVPVGAVQGATSFGKPGYGGPCPPKGTGTHHYIFELYALSESVNLPDSAGREQLMRAMKGHILSQTELTGIVAAP